MNFYLYTVDEKPCLATYLHKENTAAPLFIHTIYICILSEGEGRECSGGDEARESPVRAGLTLTSCPGCAGLTLKVTECVQG